MLVVPPGTPIRHGSTNVDFSQLVVGERIHAHGTKSGTTVTATSVEVQNEHTDVPNPGDDHGHDADENEVNGTVSGAAAGHACPAFTFSVASTTVTTTATTKFEDVSSARYLYELSVQIDSPTSMPNSSAAAPTRTR